jgi:phage shock protein C
MNQPYKKLWRSRKDRKIAGICGGLGIYFRVDPVWIRIIFVIFFLLGGAALIAYILLWIVIPLEPEPQQAVLISKEKE